MCFCAHFVVLILITMPVNFSRNRTTKQSHLIQTFKHVSEFITFHAAMQCPHLSPFYKAIEGFLGGT